MSRRRRLDVNDGVGDLRERRHQSILDDVRKTMRFMKRHRCRIPDVQVEECVIGGAAGADLMTADDFRRAHHHPADLVLGEDHAVR